MGESVRRRKYRYDRVLIESDRVLNPQFDDAVVYLTGAQIEMLRNVSQYLNRLDTYVTEYNPGYYIAPTAEDYDDILEIVADLEETLMGNPNTIWGYNDRYADIEVHTKSGAGDYIMWGAIVPEGYVYVLQSVQSRNANTVTKQVHRLADGVNQYEIDVFAGQPAGEYAIVKNVDYVLKHGDLYGVEFFDCQDGDGLRVRFWGYKMKVPA